MLRPLLVLIAVAIGTPLAMAAEPPSSPPHSPPHSPPPSPEELRERIENASAPGDDMLAIGKVTLAAAVAQFYRQHDYRLIWDEPRARQLLAALAATAEDGLQPEDYHLAQLQRELPLLPKAGPRQRIDFDLLATDAYLRALVHLFRGKVDPQRLDARWNFQISDLASTRALEVVTQAVDENRVADAFAAARPQHALYAEMRRALAELRELAARGGWSQLADGPALKPGMQDARVPALRERLRAAGFALPDAGGEIYDDATVEAVKQFQRDQLASSDGAVGSATLALLNVPVQQRIEEQRADLERARWLLHDVKADFVLVNAAAFTVNYYRGDASIWNARVQVGMPARNTPIFKSKITHITLNPSWVVPPTIFRKDVVPKLRKNPNYLEESRLRILDQRGQPVPAAQVNWERPGNIVLKQDPGPHSALGRAAIRFPNPYTIYLHDTPHQELFSANRRTFSSGCIRVERALELVELLLAGTPWTRAAIDAELEKNQTRNVNVAQPIPILLTYWTVQRTPEGRIAFKPDVYARTPALLRALNAR